MSGAGVVAGEVVAPIVANDGLKGSMMFISENDLFTASGRDMDYTFGGRIAWLSHEVSRAEFNALDRVLSLGLGGENGHYQRGLSLNHQIYTPQDKSLLSSPPGERPYAGWTGIGYSLHKSNDQVLSSIELVVGNIGPDSMAQTAQDTVHAIVGDDDFDGWDSQVPNEITFDIKWSQKRRLSWMESADADGWSCAGNLDLGCSLGTYRTDGYVGIHWRGGWNVAPSFSAVRISPTAYGFDDRQSGERWSIFFQSGVQGNVILHDATLDGPVFRDFDTGADREPLSAEAYVGIGVQKGDWEISYTQSVRSSDFEGQDKSVIFASLSMKYMY